MGHWAPVPGFPSRTGVWCSSHFPIPDRSPLIPPLLAGATHGQSDSLISQTKTFSPTRARILQLVAYRPDCLPALPSSRLSHLVPSELAWFW